MVDCENSLQLWEKLNQNFSLNWKANIIQLAIQLQNVKKGSMSIIEYFLKFKEITNAIGLTSHLISEENQILQVLAGLGQDYDSIVALVSFARDLYSMSGIQAQLLSYEFRLNQRSPWVWMLPMVRIKDFNLLILAIEAGKVMREIVTEVDILANLVVL